jgi:hypothetical protein
LHLHVDDIHQGDRHCLRLKSENSFRNLSFILSSYDLFSSIGYLDKVLSGTVAELCTSGKNFDISGRNKETPQMIAENIENVLYFVSKFFDCIVNSLDIMPLEFRLIANALQVEKLLLLFFFNQNH